MNVFALLVNIFYNLSIYVHMFIIESVSSQQGRGWFGPQEKTFGKMPADIFTCQNYAVSTGI